MADVEQSGMGNPSSTTFLSSKVEASSLVTGLSRRSVTSTASPASVIMMAGFASERAKKPKETPPSLTKGEGLARAMQKEFNTLRKEGGVVAQVFARKKGTEQWYRIGNVRNVCGIVC